jgi:hypothetical protein
MNDSVVQELWDWLEHAANQYSDGDLEGEDFEKLADIIRSIPSNVKLPKSFWIY